jgi:hypothetical protein
MSLREVIQKIAISKYNMPGVGFSCAACILDPLFETKVLHCDRAKTLGILDSSDFPPAALISEGFAGYYTCKALSSAVLAIELGQSNKFPDKTLPKDFQEKLYKLFDNIYDDFKTENGGHRLCRHVWNFRKGENRCQSIIEKYSGIAYDYLTLPDEKLFDFPPRPDVGKLQ